jgi:deazaflavin-dependent oxidoreductase (nitroreductase family)
MYVEEEHLMTVEKKQLFIENHLPYPSGRVMQMVYRSPIWLYRLGLGPLVGRGFMILTTTGRKSCLPRRTAIEFHQHHGRKYVMVGWTAANWYKNILANPLVTIQTAWGTERVRARRITTIEDLREAWEVAEHSPIIQGVIKLTGLSWESFVAQQDRYIILTFDPTDEPTPPPLEADLRWVTLVALSSIVLSVLLQRWIRTRRRRRR